MGEIVNLRRARKERKRAQRDGAAAANKLAFGRSKTEKRATDAQERLRRDRLEAHRLEPAAVEDES